MLIISIRYTMSFFSFFFLLADILIFNWPKIFVFGQVLFSSTCMCLCVSLSVWVSAILFLDYLKKFLSDFDVIGRMIYDYQEHILFEDELNRLIRTEVTISLLFLQFFLVLFFLLLPSLFIIKEVKCNEL